MQMKINTSNNFGQSNCRCKICGRGFDKNKEDDFPYVVFPQDDGSEIVAIINFGLVRDGKPMGIVPICNDCKPAYYEAAIANFHKGYKKNKQ